MESADALATRRLVEFVSGKPRNCGAFSLAEKLGYAGAAEMGVTMGTALSEADVQAALKKIPDWKMQGKAIERVFQFENFSDAMVFVNHIAEAAEEVNHHPDITINYNKVTLQLISHDSGGVTNRDIKMATRINEVAGK
jgi:4a-hydroxytetrahydrobiopterin dehydratase